MAHALTDTIEQILDRAPDLTIATVRPDGYPQATTVSFVSEGRDIYFGCGALSQKAQNISRDDRVSITVNLPYRHWNEILGLSLSGRAQIVKDPGEAGRIFAKMIEKFPQVKDFDPAEGAEMVLIHVRPEVISVLDYAKGFGHTDLVHLENA